MVANDIFSILGTLALRIILDGRYQDISKGVYRWEKHLHI